LNLHACALALGQRSLLIPWVTFENSPYILVHIADLAFEQI